MGTGRIPKRVKKSLSGLMSVKEILSSYYTALFGIALKVGRGKGGFPSAVG